MYKYTNEDLEFMSEHRLDITIGDCQRIGMAYKYAENAFFLQVDMGKSIYQTILQGAEINNISCDFYDKIKNKRLLKLL